MRLFEGSSLAQKHWPSLEEGGQQTKHLLKGCFGGQYSFIQWKDFIGW